ncbi:MAG: LLM class flavin-dependent oxidoreductase [Myxococcota bacterium]|jgi:alkanesulfonate monooxygenase SsuD/methylene tetrahydromethanopterin reductase-like flavin-dependent oxidoreductase (luciferase family)
MSDLQTPSPAPTSSVPPGTGSKARWGLEGLALGVALGGVGRPGDWQRHFERLGQCEALGLHSVWLPEMHFAPGACSTPLSLLAAFAAKSTKLRLGTTSLLLPIHHPVQLADEVSDLRALSGDRVILGLGRGFRRPLFEAFQVPAQSKRNRFDDHLEAMLVRWAGRGEGPPPMGVAAFGRKGLAQAARHGLPYLPSPLESLDLIAENLSFHAAALSPEKNAAPLAVPLMRTVFVSEDEAAVRSVLEAIEREARALQVGRVPAALGRAAKAPIESRVLVGSPSQVRHELARYRERIGVDLLIARIEVPGVAPKILEASLEALATEVVPALVSAPS